MKTKTDYCSELQATLNQRMRGGSWIPLWPSDLETLSPRQAIVFGIVLNLAKERADQDGFLLLQPRYLHNSPLRLSNTAQEDALGALCKLGLLTVKYRNGTRVVRVNLTAYKSLADGTLTEEDEEDGFDFDAA